MRPHLARSILPEARLATRNAPVRLVSTTSVNCSSVIRSSSVSAVMPALATSTSTGPSSASTAVNAASMEAASVTSARTANRLPCWPAPPAPNPGSAPCGAGHSPTPVGDRHPVALLGEGLRDGQADSPVAPGHQHGTGHCSPLRMVSTDASEPRRYRQVSANGSRVTPGYDTGINPWWHALEAAEP